MKNILLFTLSLLFACGALAQLPKVSRDSISNVAAQTAAALSHAALKQNLPQTLKIVFEEEKPTDYQKEQILNALKKLVDGTRGKKFPSYQDMTIFINNLLEYEYEEGVLLKDAFAESENQAPKMAGLDCDSRSILVLAAIEALGYPLGRNIYLAQTIIKRKSEMTQIVADLFGTDAFGDIYSIGGHVVLYDGKNFIDMTNNQTVKLSEEELLLSNVLNTPDKVRSLLITNTATEKALKAKGNIMTRKPDDKPAMAEATKEFQKALELNPKNLIALENLASVSKNIDYDFQAAGIMMANYIDIYSWQPIDIKNISAETRLERKPEPKNPALEAIKNSAPIYKKLLDLQAKAFFADRYKEVLEIGSFLLQADSGDKDGFINGYMAKACWELKDYDNAQKYAARALAARSNHDYQHKPGADFDYIFGELEEYAIISGIMSGTIILTDENIALFAEQSQVISQLMTGGGINVRYMTPAETLRNWEGCAETAAKLSPQTAPGAKDFCNKTK
jgi:hypothetical protein